MTQRPRGTSDQCSVEHVALRPAENNEITARLEITEGTVKFDLHSIYARLRIPARERRELHAGRRKVDDGEGIDDELLRHVWLRRTARAGIAERRSPFGCRCCVTLKGGEPQRGEWSGHRMREANAS